MEITQEEYKLLQKYLDTQDESILERIIDHPWAYSGQIIQVAIGIKCVNLAPKRIVCWNSILISEEIK